MWPWAEMVSSEDPAVRYGGLGQQERTDTYSGTTQLPPWDGRVRGPDQGPQPAPLLQAPPWAVVNREVNKAADEFERRLSSDWPAMAQPRVREAENRNENKNGNNKRQK